MPTSNSTPFMVSEDDWDTKEGPLRMYCTYFGVPKDTSRDKATLNSKNIEPIALAVIELR